MELVRVNDESTDIIYCNARSRWINIKIKEVLILNKTINKCQLNTNQHYYTCKGTSIRADGTYKSIINYFILRLDSFFLERILSIDQEVSDSIRLWDIL